MRELNTYKGQIHRQSQIKDLNEDIVTDIIKDIHNYEKLVSRIDNYKNTQSK